MSNDSSPTKLRVVGASTQLEIIETGRGRPILFLHPGIGLRGAEPFLKALGRFGRVIAPAHPGFHGSPVGGFKSVDDLSYLYLSLLEDLDEAALIHRLVARRLDCARNGCEVDRKHRGTSFG